MALNKGTLVTSPIRPNDSLDTYPSAYAVEIKGGLHTTQDTTTRDNIPQERREWGMLCYVIDDNLTYQLSYGYVDSDITNNSNWKTFETGGGGGEWIDSVFTTTTVEPSPSTTGERYLIGKNGLTPPTGANWITGAKATQVAEWNGSNWIYTSPTENMSVRIDDEDNSIYRYSGTFDPGNNLYGEWLIEKESQVRSISAIRQDDGIYAGLTYSATTTPPINGYDSEIIFLTTFDQASPGPSASLDINSFGPKSIKIVDGNVKRLADTNEIIPNIKYVVIYNSSTDEFEIINPSNKSQFFTKWNLQSGDNIIVPPDTQYFVFGDLNLNTGSSITLPTGSKLTVLNGTINELGGTINELGGLKSELSFIYSQQPALANQLTRWDKITTARTSQVIAFQSSVTDDLKNVIIGSPTVSTSGVNKFNNVSGFQPNVYIGHYSSYATSSLVTSTTGPVSPTFSTTRLVSISASNINFFGATFTSNNTFVYPKNPVQGYILVSDTTGVASWTQSKYVWSQNVSAYTTYSVTHSFGTTDILTSTWDESTGEQIMITVVKKNSNVLDVHSTVDVSPLKVVVMRY